MYFLDSYVMSPREVPGYLEAAYRAADEGAYQTSPTFIYAFHESHIVVRLLITLKYVRSISVAEFLVCLPYYSYCGLLRRFLYRSSSGSLSDGQRSAESLRTSFTL